VHIERSLSRRYSFGRAVGVCARQRFVLARGQDYSFLLHVLTDRGRITGYPEVIPKKCGSVRIATISRLALIFCRALIFLASSYTDHAASHFAMHRRPSRWEA
jgi:hypothetical protein